jgi:hypothetical protein
MATDPSTIGSSDGSFAIVTTTTTVPPDTIDGTSFAARGNQMVAKYPSTLWTPPYDKWIMFRAMSGRHVIRNTVVVENNKADVALRSVGLYLPEGAIQSTTLVNYAKNDLGPMYGAAAEVFAQGGTNLMASGHGGSSFVDSFTDKLTSVAGALPSMKTLGMVGDTQGYTELMKVQISKILGAVAEKFGATSGAALSATIFGQKPNPRTTLLYDAADYRQHILEFNLIPRNLDEAKAIDTILYFFQYYMLPRYQDALSMQQDQVGAFMVGFPYEFEIDMYSANPNGSNVSLTHLNQIGRSVLSSVQINHAGGGRTAFIKDSGEFYPVATKLQLTFQEVNLLARDDATITRGGASGVSFNNSTDDPRG